MSGNVWEWTLDEWHTSYEGAPSQAETPRGDIISCNQICDSGSSNRVDRGGAWHSIAWLLRVANRSYSFSNARADYVGFRVRKTSP